MIRMQKQERFLHFHLLFARFMMPFNLVLFHYQLFLIDLEFFLYEKKSVNGRTLWFDFNVALLFDEILKKNCEKNKQTTIKTAVWPKKQRKKSIRFFLFKKGSAKLRKRLEMWCVCVCVSEYTLRGHCWFNKSPFGPIHFRLAFFCEHKTKEFTNSLSSIYRFVGYCSAAFFLSPFICVCLTWVGVCACVSSLAPFKLD